MVGTRIRMGNLGNCGGFDGRVPAMAAISGYPSVMPEAQDVATQPSGLDPQDRRWLRERLIEYRELLAYLRDH